MDSLVDENQWKVWGRVAPTPGNREEMVSLRAELSGAIGLLLVIYAIQVYMEGYEFPNYVIYVWIDNAEVLTRARSTDV